MKRIALLLLAYNLTNAQNEHYEKFVKDSLSIMQPKLVRPQVKFDNRVTFYEGQTLAIGGFDAGVLLKDKLRLTLGYYRLNADLDAFRETIDSNNVGRLININYGTLNMEFLYLQTRFFSLGMPVEIGAGQSELKFKNFTNDRIYRSEKGLMAISHFGLAATFTPIRWIGLKGIVGYRKSLYTQVKAFNFDGFFTSLGLNIDFREIIRDIKMYNLKKRYRRGNNISNAVDLITD